MDSEPLRDRDPPPRPTDRELYVVPARLRVCTGDELEPGASGAWRVPGPLVVLLSPVLGGLYAVAFPLVVFATLFGVIRARLRPRRAGTSVPWGLYLGLRSPRWVEVREEGGRLPGPAGARYVRVPRLALLLLSPVLGGLFFLGLPFLVGAAFIAVPIAHLWRAASGRIAFAGRGGPPRQGGGA
jgi:hypothetical protein